MLTGNIAIGMNKSFIIRFFSFIIALSFTGSCLAYDYYAAGKSALEKGEYSRAGNYFNKALQKSPGHTKCRYYYALSLINLKNFDKARKEYEKIIETAPLSNEARLASVGISQIKRYELIRRGKLKASGKRKTNLSNQKVNIESIGDNYIINAIDGSKVTRWNSEKMPIKLYIERSTGVEGYRDYYYSMAEKAMKDWVNSAHGNLLSYVIVTDPTQANIQLYFVGEIMKKTGKNFIAGLATPHVKQHLLHYYDVKITAVKPPDKRSFTEKEIYRTILHELGHALGIRGHSSNKSDIMYAGVESNPKHLDAGLSERDVNTITLLYTLEPDISNFNKGQKAIADSERNEKILGSKNERLRKKLEEALEYTGKYPDNILSWVQLGKAYLDMQSYDYAVTSLQIALKIDPDFPNAIETLAFVYKGKGDFSRASEQFEKLVSLEPDNISFSYNYALYLIENKRYDKAKEILYSLRVKNPGANTHPDVKNLVDYLGRI